MPTTRETILTALHARLSALPATALRRERQAEGIKAAKGKGVYRGRAPKIDMASIQAKLIEGCSPTEISREMGISRGTVYKAKAQLTREHDSIKAGTP